MILEPKPEQRALNPGPPLPEQVDLLESQRELVVALVENELEGAPGQVELKRIYTGKEINVSARHITQGTYAGGILLRREMETGEPADREGFLRHATHGFHLEIDFRRRGEGNERSALLCIITEDGGVFAQSHERKPIPGDPLWLSSDKRHDHAQVDRATGRLIGKLAKHLLGDQPLRLAEGDREKTAMRLAAEAQSMFLESSVADDRTSRLVGRYLAEELLEQLMDFAVAAQVKAMYNLADKRELHVVIRPGLYVNMDPTAENVHTLDLELVEPHANGARRFTRLTLPGTSTGEVVIGRRGSMVSQPLGKAQPARTEDYVMFLAALDDPSRKIISK